MHQIWFFNCMSWMLQNEWSFSYDENLYFSSSFLVRTLCKRKNVKFFFWNVKIWNMMHRIDKQKKLFKNVNFSQFKKIACFFFHYQKMKQPKDHISKPKLNNSRSSKKKAAANDGLEGWTRLFCSINQLINLLDDEFFESCIFA